MKTHEKIVRLLKEKGALTAKDLALELSLTTMGIRQHVQALEESGDVVFKDQTSVRGRPTRYWSLTEKSHRHFVDKHDELTVQMIDSVIAVFGDDGLDKLIEHRESESMRYYRLALGDQHDIKKRLDILAKIRSDEGYMAVVEEEDTDNGKIFWLLENHCPICAAAKKCLQFCRSELDMFQALMSELATVTREEHIIDGARRCAYKIAPI